MLNQLYWSRIVLNEHDFQGLPLDWAHELSLCPIFLPEITPDHTELQRDFSERLSSIGEMGQDDFNFNDDDVDAAQILSAERVETDALDARAPLRISPLRIITTDLSLNRSYFPSSGIAFLSISIAHLFIRLCGSLSIYPFFDPAGWCSNALHTIATYSISWYFTSLLFFSIPTRV